MPKDAKGHGSNPRTSLHKPISDHAYHGKSDDELHYIVKDATEAAKASQSMGKLETKYNDQINDAATVLGYRKRLSDGDAASSLKSTSGKSETVSTHSAMGGGHNGNVTSVERGEGESDHSYISRRVGENSSTHNSHGNAWGSPEAIADFKRDHGTSKGFASGKREINRLKRRGK